MDSHTKSTKAGAPEGSVQEISHADGALELELPEDGATIDSPPNGGLRAWLIVLSCASINGLLGIVFVLIRASLVLDDDDGTIMYEDTGIDQDTLDEVSDQFLNMADIYAPFAAFVMIFLGYQPTVCIGAGVVMATLFFLSYLGDDDTEHFIKFLIYGPIAAGISFVRLGALIPVLEYFTTQRLKALFLSRLGSYIGEILLVGFLYIPNLTFKWRVCLRGSSALCIGIGILGLTLKDLKLKMRDDESATFVQRTLGLAKRDILRNVLVWLTCLVYLFYQWGIEPGQAQFTHIDTAEQLNFGGNLAKSLFFGFSQSIGMIIGMFLAWIFKKAAIDETSRFYSVKIKNSILTVIFGILIVNTFTMGIGCFIAPHAIKFAYFFMFSVIYGAFFAFCEGLRDDAVPELFGRENTRIVEGLILMAVGVGGVVTNAISAEIENDEDDGWENIFRYAGGMLMFSTFVTAAVLYLYHNKHLDQMTAKLSGNSVSPINSTTDTRQPIRRSQQPGGQTDTNIPYTDDIKRNVSVGSNSGDPGHRQRSTQVSNHTRQDDEPMSMYDL